MWQEVSAKNIFKSWNGFILFSYLPLFLHGSRPPWRMSTLLTIVNWNIEQAILVVSKSLLLVILSFLPLTSAVVEVLGGVGHSPAAGELSWTPLLQLHGSGWLGSQVLVVVEGLSSPFRACPCFFHYPARSMNSFAGVCCSCVKFRVPVISPWFISTSKCEIYKKEKQQKCSKREVFSLSPSVKFSFSWNGFWPFSCHLQFGTIGEPQLSAGGSTAVRLEDGRASEGSVGPRREALASFLLKGTTPCRAWTLQQCGLYEFL